MSINGCHQLARRHFQIYLLHPTLFDPNTALQVAAEHRFFAQFQATVRALANTLQREQIIVVREFLRETDRYADLTDEEAKGASLLAPVPVPALAL